ncbi:hypothetical protein Tco_0838124 [Tanacetum coccineum]|uniref:Uncharacterized protein n=1 Tax=Tanacetum coccineum TaxID=301880 RepID=A0ABQ5APG9_9ASTR
MHEIARTSAVIPGILDRKGCNIANSRQSTGATRASSRAFVELETFKFQLSQHMNNLETQLNAEILHEMDSKSALSVIKEQFKRFINSDLLKPLDIYSRSFSSDREAKDSEFLPEESSSTYQAIENVDYDKLEHKLNEALGLIAQKETDIKEGLKVKAYEISVVKEKHDELVKQSLLTKSHYEGLVKEKTKIKFLNEIVYKRSQSIQTIHMLAPKCPTFNGRPTFANPRYLKKAQNEIPCLYAIPHDQSDPANRLVPDREETQTLEEESRSKLNKDLVKPFDYTKLNSLYEIFKPPITSNNDIQSHKANEIRKNNVEKNHL